MKIAYKEKDCVDKNGYLESCSGCIYEQLADRRIWPCDLIPRLKCYGSTIYAHSNNLSEIFQV